MLRIEAKDGMVEIRGSERLHRFTPEEARGLIETIEDAIPREFNEDGYPVCPKCGMEAEEDREDFWVCGQVECNGFHQTVYEGDPLERDEEEEG